MSEQHDGDERGQFPPERLPGVTERDGEAEHEGDADSQRDQRHHSRKPISKFAGGANEKRPASIQVNRCPKHRWNIRRSRKRRRSKAKP
jgi:hypothetical protein